MVNMSRSKGIQSVSLFKERCVCREYGANQVRERRNIGARLGTIPTTSSTILETGYVTVIIRNAHA